MNIPQCVIEELISQAEKDAPDESCGYLLGTEDEVTENYWRYARTKGLKILANWHSHPATPSRPSQEDLRLANDPNIRYAILSLMDGEPRLNSFRIINGDIIDKEIHL